MKKPSYTSPMDGARRSRQLVEAASDRLEQALERAPIPAKDAAAISKARFDREVAEPGGIDKPFRALDHHVLQTAGRVALSAGQDHIDHKALRQAVGVWKGHAGRHTNLSRARENAAAALEALIDAALPHKRPQIDAAKRTRRFVDALYTAEKHSREG